MRSLSSAGLTFLNTLSVCHPDTQIPYAKFKSSNLPLTFSQSCSHPVAIRLVMSKNVSVMRVTSAGLQKSTLGVRGIPKAIWQLSPKSRVQQATLWAKAEQDVSHSPSKWVMWLCLLLLAFLHACHSCCLVRQMGRNRIYSAAISWNLCCCVLKWLFVALCVMAYACVFSFSVSSGPLSLSFVLWLWLHPVSSHKLPPPLLPPPTYDMV